MAEFKRGDIVFIIENGRNISSAKILNCAGGFYTLQMIGRTGALRVKAHRLYRSEQDAKRSLGISDGPRYNPLNYQ